MAMTLGQLASKFAQAATRVDSVGEKRMATLAQVGVGLVKREIQAVHAVDTGTMVNSSSAEKIAPKTWLIGPTVDYAVFVALGTSRMAARPFHITAAKQLASQAKDAFKAADLGL